MNREFDGELKDNTNLLEFVLNKTGAAKISYAILVGESEIDPPELDFGGLHLRVLDSDNIQVYAVERDQRLDVAKFQELHTAFKYLYWRITQSASQWAYREEWEASLNE